MLSCLFTIILTTPSSMQHFLECTDLFQDSSSSHSLQIVQEKEREMGRCNQINTNPIKFKHSHSLAKNCQMANQMFESENSGKEKRGFRNEILLNEAERLYFCLSTKWTLLLATFPLHIRHNKLCNNKSIQLASKVFERGGWWGEVTWKKLLLEQSIFTAV